MSALLLAVMGAALAVATVYDLKTRHIPDAPLAAAGGVALLARALIGEPGALGDGALGALVCGGALLALALVADALMGRGALGGGDVKLMAMAGACLGLRLGVLGLMLSAVVGGVCACVLLLTRRASMGQELPMAGFFAAGCLIAGIWGEAMIAGYLRLLGLT